MIYESKHLSEEENLLVKRSLDQSTKIICTTVAQIYTYEQSRTEDWAFLTTGGLYLAKSCTDVLSMGLFHFLKNMIEWEEEVYLEMKLKHVDDCPKVLTFEGKKCVILLSFAFDDECRIFMDTFERSKSQLIDNFEDGNIYSEIRDLDFATPPNNPKENKKAEIQRLKVLKKEAKLVLKLLNKEEKLERECKKKEEKLKRERKKKEEKLERERKQEEQKQKKKNKNELDISGPIPGTFAHNGSAKLLVGGLNFEGSLANNLFGQSMQPINNVNTRKSKVKEDLNEKHINVTHNQKKHMKFTLIPDKPTSDHLKSAPDISTAKRYITNFSSPTSHERRQIIDSHTLQRQDLAKGNIQPLPKPVKPQLQPPSLDRKPENLFIPPQPPTSHLTTETEAVALDVCKEPEIKFANSGHIMNKKGPPVPPGFNMTKDTPTTTSKVPGRNDLLSQICEGIALKPVKESKDRSTKTMKISLENKNTGISDPLHLALKTRFQAIHPKEEEQEQTYYPPEEWND